MNLTGIVYTTLTFFPLWVPGSNFGKDETTLLASSSRLSLTALARLLSLGAQTPVVGDYAITVSDVLVVLSMYGGVCD